MVVVVEDADLVRDGVGVGPYPVGALGGLDVDLLWAVAVDVVPIQAGIVVHIGQVPPQGVALGVVAVIGAGAVPDPSSSEEVEVDVGVVRVPGQLHQELIVAACTGGDACGLCG